MPEAQDMIPHSTRSSSGSDYAPADVIATSREELDHLFSIAYEELRRLASSVRRSDPGATLTPSTLVNEAWLKLANSPPLAATSRVHFKRIAARAMRQVLIESARRRTATKRGGKEASFVTFDEELHDSASGATEILALDAALDALAHLLPRQAMIVEYHFFGGLDLVETAELLQLSESTIHREWRAARAWLAHELRRER
jgi:RNA polymerase sigma factor (TIGR02999 family)